MHRDFYHTQSAQEGSFLIIQQKSPSSFFLDICCWFCYGADSSEGSFLIIQQKSPSFFFLYLLLILLWCRFLRLCLRSWFAVHIAFKGEHCTFTQKKRGCKQMTQFFVGTLRGGFMEHHGHVPYMFLFLLHHAFIGIHTHS